MLKLSLNSICILSMLACTPSTQETINKTPESSLNKKVIQTKDYNPNKNVYFGDLHIHTKIALMPTYLTCAQRPMMSIVLLRVKH